MHLSACTGGKEPLLLLVVTGSGVDAGNGVEGAESSGVGGNSPPKASSRSVCFFLLPSFIPELLNAGARDVVVVGVEIGDDVRVVSDGSYRGTRE